MTVGEFIRHLMDFDQDLPVFVLNYGYEGGAASPTFCIERVRPWPVAGPEWVYTPLEQTHDASDALIIGMAEMTHSTAEGP